MGAILCVTLCALSRVVPAAYDDDVHFTELSAQYGAAAPTGAGVAVSQVEAPVIVGVEGAWMPNPAEFSGKVLTDLSNGPDGVYSSHATGVGLQFYGTSNSIAPGITSVAGYNANRWVAGDFLQFGTTSLPRTSTARIGNHSWIGSGDTPDANILRRLDWVVETDEFIQVVAERTPGEAVPSTLLANAFNVITVGRSDGLHGTGSLAIDSTYVAGRTRPDLVIPATSLSQATPRVSAAAALLVQAGHANAALSTDPVVASSVNRAGVLVRNAERSEVVKAALMAGADRVTHNSTTSNLSMYRVAAANRTANGLDSRYGAGQVNVLNSYHIIASREQNSAEDGGPASGTADAGFDYDPRFGGATGTNATATYVLPVSGVPRLLTAALVWNLDILGGTSTFSGTAYVHHLALSVVNISNGATVFTAQGAADNTENAWLVVPAWARYELRVTRAAGAAYNYDYAIAWQLINDADADGANDREDNCIHGANGPIIRDAGGASQRDSDGDGYGNICDGDLNNTSVVTSADFLMLRNALNTAGSNADLDGSGMVTSADYTLLRDGMNLAPGPSGVAP